MGEPTFESIRDMHCLLTTNVASVPSGLGGGNHGHLGLALDRQGYFALTGAVFTKPNNPGPIPIFPPNVNAQQVQAIEHQHKKALHIFTLCDVIEKELKQQLLKAFDTEYTRSLEAHIVGYLNVSVIQLVQHLYYTYGDISPTVQADNDARIRLNFLLNR